MKLQREIRLFAKVWVKPYRGLELAGGFCLVGVQRIQERTRESEARRGGKHGSGGEGLCDSERWFNKALGFSLKKTNKKKNRKKETPAVTGADASPQTQLANSEGGQRGQKHTG